ncbi:MAG: hypothetical protein WCR78_00460 [Arcobacteraceae bacterium]|jgi:hypothetical protein
MENLPEIPKEEIVKGELLIDNQQSLAMREGANQTNLVHRVSQNLENANQRYWNAEMNSNQIFNNEIGKYNFLINNQNNLLQRINNPEIKLWRYQNKLYYRDNSGQLIIGNNSAIEKELSSRYGVNVHFVNDMNDALKNNNQYRTNTIFIAINNITVVEEEVFDNNQLFEIFNTYNGSWKRNLLAYTRFNKKRIPR